MKTKIYAKRVISQSVKIIHVLFMFTIVKKNMRVDNLLNHFGKKMTYQTSALMKSRKPKLRVGLFQSRTCSRVARWGRSSHRRRSSMLVGGLGRRQFLMRRKIFEKNVILNDSDFLCDVKYSVQYAFYWNSTPLSNVQISHCKNVTKKNHSTLIE